MFNAIICAVQYIVFAFALYYLLLATAGLFSRRPCRDYPPLSRFAVIVPAHNEAQVLGKLIDNLLELDYPRELYDIFIIADNCSDHTAQVARNQGVAVWERFSPNRRGKGFALEDALKRIGLTGPKCSTAYDLSLIHI